MYSNKKNCKHSTNNGYMELQVKNYFRLFIFFSFQFLSPFSIQCEYEDSDLLNQRLKVWKTIVQNLRKLYDANFHSLILF